MGPEARILKAIERWLQSLWRDGEPIWWLKVHGGPMQRAGVPDLLVCHRGWFVGLEVKAPGKEPTGLQEETMRRIVEAGGVACAVTSADEAAAALEVGR